MRPGDRRYCAAGRTDSSAATLRRRGRGPAIPLADAATGAARRCQIGVRYRARRRPGFCLGNTRDTASGAGHCRYRVARSSTGHDVDHGLDRTGRTARGPACRRGDRRQRLSHQGDQPARRFDRGQGRESIDHAVSRAAEPDEREGRGVRWEPVAASRRNRSGGHPGHVHHSRELAWRIRARRPIGMDARRRQSRPCDSRRNRPCPNTGRCGHRSPLCAGGESSRWVASVRGHPCRPGRTMAVRVRRQRPSSPAC